MQLTRWSPLKSASKELETQLNSSCPLRLQPFGNGANSNHFALAIPLMANRIRGTMPHADHEIIGWKESIDLPDWGISHITAKADTGARRSAIDVKHILELPNNQVQFEIVLEREDRNFTQTVIADIAHQTHVRSSNGQQHERYFVRTNIKLGKHTKLIELSLVDRKNMTCRMLLGRKALENDFLVDSSQTHLTRSNKKLKVIPTDITPTT